ncbi:hypothetical protein LTR78_000818 [Recurvomyces mirabilis]|uniref:Zn(2)-C6 fungal-type domain-containing protein n=1 Tax=Recurvomyces mirabilis TaxID=574656 RepID=A0AAE0WWF7_9PEZI|nr:hypothetical protein LTR78_000818 [Recurvomyces mirabilis]KAK5158787.1 hypothetical protein LTS14_002895 [Recurvomyces mirabilis]
MTGADQGGEDTVRGNGKKRASAGDSNAPKRSRVSRACDQCRASREKCDGTQPTCLTCTSQDRECTYHEQPKKRGIQPNYIRTLESSLAWLFQTWPQTEVLLSEKLANVDDETHKALAGKDAPSAETMHRMWRNGIVCKQIDQVLSGAPIDSPKITLAQQDLQERLEPVRANQHASEIWPRSGTDSMPSRNGGPSQYDVNRPAAVEILRETCLDPQLQGSLTHNMILKPNELHKLPSSAWSFLDYFVAFTYSWLPITDKQEILKLMYTFPPEGLSKMDLAKSASYAELLSIMALVALQTHDDSESDRLRDIVYGLLPSYASDFKLSHVKTLLILTVAEVIRERWPTAWIVVGCALRLSLLAHSDPNEQRLNIVVQAAVVLETTIADYLHQQPQASMRQMQALGEVAEDGLDEWSLWHDPLEPVLASKAPMRAFSTFNGVVRQAFAGLEALEQASSDSPIPQAKVARTVSCLLSNSVLAKGRKHPADVLSSSNQPPARVNYTPQSTANGQQASLPYLSIPTNASSDTAGLTPILHSEHHGFSDDWLSQPLPPMTSALEQSAFQGSDIFEELAMLERADSRQQPQFMQNLGFAPDLDLAEFFGADYQLSDPVLAYMQPPNLDLPSTVGAAVGDNG